MYNPPQIQKNPQMPVVLIAGGAGFIGSHLTDYLLSQGFRVVVVDSLESGKKEYLAGFTSHPRFAFLQFDLNQGLPKKIEGVDYIVNLAGEELHLFEKGGLNADSLVTNALANHNLLDLANKCSAKVLIASSINVYQGVASSTSLNNYFGKTDEEEHAFSFSESKRFAESLAFEYHKRYNTDVRVVRLGEVYGPRMDLRATSNLGRFIENLLRGDNLVVYGDGLEKEYYCYISDTIDGLVKALFKSGTAGAIFPLTDLSPITILEQAYLLKSFALPGTQIIFKPKFDDLEIPAIKVVDGKIQRELKWKPKISLKDGVKMTLENFGFNKNRPGTVKNTPLDRTEVIAENFIPPGRYEQERRKAPTLQLPQLDLGASFSRFSKKRILGTALLSLVAFALLIGFPFLPTTYHLGLTFIEFQKAERNLKEVKIEEVIEGARKINDHITAARDSLDGSPFFHGSETIKVLNSVSFFSQAVKVSAEGLVPLNNDFLRLGFGTPAAASPEKFEDELARQAAAENFSSAGDLLDLATAELKEVNPSRLPTIVRDKLPLYEKILLDASELLKKLSLIAKMAPTVLGLEGEKSYLLVFQNSNELRPTGGFIGSLGKVKLNKGHIEQIKIIDVYDIDGQIDDRQIKIIQPRFLTENLKTDYLHLRDANYSPSFPESAERVKDIYTEITDEDLDGIIALDLATIEGLLKITGPIFLPTYNETITGDNVFERSQFHSEAAFFPGSTQKKTFLSILSQQLIDSVFALDKKNYFNLIKEVETLLTQKHILVYIPDEQSSISQLNWDGRMINTNDDYLMIVDANVGSNKSNYFVDRSIDYRIEKNNREDEYLAELRINYKHAGTSNAWPGGPYKNYLRVYTPKKSSLLKVLLSSSGTDASEDITDQTEISDELGKTSFATTITVETGQSISLLFTYVLPQNTSAAISKYKLTVQKQPGIKDESFTLKFRLPFGSTFTTPSGNYKLLGDTVEWNGIIKQDAVIEIPLKP